VKRKGPVPSGARQGGHATEPQDRPERKSGIRHRNLRSFRQRQGAVQSRAEQGSRLKDNKNQQGKLRNRRTLMRNGQSIGSKGVPSSSSTDRKRAALLRTTSPWKNTEKKAVRKHRGQNVIQFEVFEKPTLTFETAGSGNRIFKLEGPLSGRWGAIVKGRAGNIGRMTATTGVHQREAGPKSLWQSDVPSQTESVDGTESR